MKPRNPFAWQKDRNHAAVVGAFRRAGCSVVVIDSATPPGCPDLLVGAGGCDYLVEIKDGAKSASHRKLRASQVEFAAAWRGARPMVVESAVEAFALGRRLAAGRTELERWR